MNNDAYYAKAEGWALDRQRGLERSRGLAWTVAMAAVSVAVLEAGAMMYMLPLKTTSTVAMLVDRTTGYTQVIDPAAPRRINPDGALTNSLLAQYVTAREGYDRATIQQDYRKVALFSTGSARASYLASMRTTDPGSAFARFGRDSVMAITVKSVSMLGPRTALVRFDRALTGPQGNYGPQRPQVAVVRFRFSDAPMKVADRFTNPLGFQVISYRVDDEAPTTAAGDEA